MANLNFDATTVEPNEPFTVIPAGKYPAQVVASELRPTKNGDGQYLWLEMDIIDGQYKGRKLWPRINMANPNPQAVEIGQRELSALCHAVGELHVADTEQLHFKPMLVTVRVKPAKDGYDASNEVRGYEPMGGTPARPAVVATQATATPVAQPAAPAATKTPPWRAKKAS